MFAKDSGGRRWLVKTYGGNEDRVATEALSNAIYREMGAVVPAAGLHERDGKKALAYPTVEGTTTWDGPSRQVGQHFMTDALLANHDVLGLENDNILKTPTGRRVRLDQGGTLEFRAMGQSKEFGHAVPEVESMMAKPSRQGYRSSKVTMPELRQQAQDIARRLTPERVDALVNQAPFKDSAMRERVRAALKARVQWMARFATGHETASIPHLQEVDLSEFHLNEGVSIQHLWDEAKHPRDEHGRFIQKLSDLKKGETVHLDSKTSIKRDKDGTLRVVRSGGIIKGFHHPADAARAALDRSAKSKDADSVGGATSHKDFNEYLKAHPSQVAGVSTLTGFHVSTGQVPFGAKTLDETQATKELGLLRGRLQHAEEVGKTDKYVQRTVPTLKAREHELAAKVKQVGGDDKVAAVGGGAPSAPAAQTGTAAEHPHPFIQGATFKTAGGSGNEYKVVKTDGEGIYVENVNHPAGESLIMHSTAAEKFKSGDWKLASTSTNAASAAMKQNVKNVLEDYPPGSKVKLTGSVATTVTIVGPSPSGLNVQVEAGGGGVIALSPSSFVLSKKADPEVGDTVHNPKTSYQGKIIGETPAVGASQGTYQLEGPGGVKASVPKSAFGPSGNMKVGPHPDYAPATPAAPKGKVGGKQVNGLGEGGGPAQIGKLDLALGDKLQMKKGGYNYTIVSNAGGVTKVQGPSGSTKYLSNYDRPQFVQKADKTALKLKGSAAPEGSWPAPQVGAKYKHKAGDYYTVMEVGPEWAKVKSDSMPNASPVPISSLQNKDIYSAYQPPSGGNIPAATHAEHLAYVKQALASSLGGTPLSSASSAVFSTPGGKTLFKKPDGSVWNLETGAQVNVAGNVEPPKLTTLSPTLARAELALAAKKPSAPAAPPPPPKPDAHWDSLPTGEAAESKLVSHQGGGSAGKVPSASKGAINHYTGSGYTSINPQLRTPRHIGNMHTEKSIIAMDKAMADVGGAPEEMVVWRGVNGKTGSDYQAAGKGDVIRDNGFISASVSEDFAHMWTSQSLVMKIRLPKGTKGVYVGPGTGLSDHLSEKELILNRGIAFEVVDKRQEKGKTVLVVEPVSGHL